jgi:hypothetical protein
MSAGPVFPLPRSEKSGQSCATHRVKSALVVFLTTGRDGEMVRHCRQPNRAVSGRNRCHQLSCGGSGSLSLVSLPVFDTTPIGQLRRPELADCLLLAGECCDDLPSPVPLKPSVCPDVGSACCLLRSLLHTAPGRFLHRTKRLGKCLRAFARPVRETRLSPSGVRSGSRSVPLFCPFQYSSGKSRVVWERLDSVMTHRRSPASVL